MSRALGVGGVVVLVLLVVSGLALRRAWEAGGLKERFAPCPGTPNCVSSRDPRDSHRVEPLTVGESAPAEAFRRAVEVVRALPRTRIVTRENGYLHAECRSKVFRFVDDLELLLDEETGVVHVRSASRVGRSDLGANRRRVERVRSGVQS